VDCSCLGATGGFGNSNTLVGTPEQVAQALLAYYDLGVRTIGARGFDMIDDAADFGRHVIPIVRDEVRKRDQALSESEGVAADKGNSLVEGATSE
jgi:alkanesulfonate monooxygenase